MNLFSQRYGYTPVDNAFVREGITEAIENAICNCIADFRKELNRLTYTSYDYYKSMEETLWRYFLNRRIEEFSNGYQYKVVLVDFIQDDTNPWYRKLDILECALTYLFALSEKVDFMTNRINLFVNELNGEFKRLNFAYRIIDKKIVEVTSEEEIAAIKQAIDGSKDNVREHLKKALELCSKRPVGDYRNSIKESISSVEALCRKKTGESTLGKALSKLEKNGVIIPKTLNDAFEKLYTYTNQPNTGIRHALMDNDATYTPGADEAIFMLVSCSAFVNYLNKK